jgi:type III secretion system low calcium response chaperone LcrH/SycD
MEKQNGQEITTESVRALIKSAISKLGSGYSKEEKLAQARLMVKIFEHGNIPKAAMEISDQDVAQLYSFATALFNAGQYAEARELFKVLLQLEPTMGGFAVALGACYHRLKDYENAIRCYMLAADLESADPVPLMYAYDCYMNLQNMFCAGMVLSGAAARAGRHPQYAQIKEKAQTLLSALEKELTKKAG